MGRPRKQSTGKDAAGPLPTSEEDINLVPGAHLYVEQLERHDIFDLRDFRRAYDKEKPNFRRFLQERVEVRDEQHLNAMELYFRHMDSAAAAAVAAAAAAGRGAAVTSAAAGEGAGVGAASPAAAPAAPAVVGMTCEQVTLSVEGNISAGKSTFLTILRRHLLQDQGISFVPEPIEQWQNVGVARSALASSSSDPASVSSDPASSSSSDPASPAPTVNLLELFYRDQVRMAYTFQNYVFLTRVMQERETYGITTRARILERSVFSDRMVFVRAALAGGTLAPHELAIYDAWFGPILSSLPTLVPNGLIYLRASPQTCMARLVKRARSEENSIPLSYLQCLHDNHEDWLQGGVTTLAATLRQQLLQGASAAESAAAEPHRDSGEAPSSSSQQRAAAQGAAGQRSAGPPAGGQQRQRPVEEAPPPALAYVEVPESIASCLYIVDATKVSSVSSASFLHHVPALVLDCEGDVDVAGDQAHGEAVSTLIRDFTTFVSAYRAACHRLAAAGHPTAAAMRLPAPAADYYETDPASGKVSYRPVPQGVPGAALS